MQVTAQLLSAFPLLKTLPGDLLEELAQYAKLVRYPRRKVVIESGKKSGVVCFLFEGRLQGVDFTIDGREVGLFFVEPGDFCGELGLFADGPQPEYVIALTGAAVVTLPVDILREALQKIPLAVNVLGSKLTRRIRQLSYQRTLLGLPNIAQRVCCQLWVLVPETARAQAGKDAKILNPPTHMEIAIMLNVSRETVSRVFQALQSRKIVKRDGANALNIDDLPSLKQIAEGKSEL